jgi:hypothetical protein
MHCQLLLHACRGQVAGPGASAIGVPFEAEHEAPKQFSSEGYTILQQKRKSIE